MGEGYDPSREPPSWLHHFKSLLPIAVKNEWHSVSWFLFVNLVLGALAVALVLGIFGALRGLHFLAGWMICAAFSSALQFLWAASVASKQATRIREANLTERTLWLEDQKRLNAQRAARDERLLQEAASRRARGEVVLAGLMEEVRRRRAAPALAARQRAARRAVLETRIEKEFAEFALRKSLGPAASVEAVRAAFGKHLLADPAMSADDLELLAETQKPALKSLLPQGKPRSPLGTGGDFSSNTSSAAR